MVSETSQLDISDILAGGEEYVKKVMTRLFLTCNGDMPTTVYAAIAEQVPNVFISWVIESYVENELPNIEVLTMCVATVYMSFAMRGADDAILFANQLMDALLANSVIDTFMCGLVDGLVDHKTNPALFTDMGLSLLGTLVGFQNAVVTESILGTNLLHILVDIARPRKDDGADILFMINLIAKASPRAVSVLLGTDFFKITANVYVFGAIESLSGVIDDDNIDISKAVRDICNEFGANKFVKILLLNNDLDKKYSDLFARFAVRSEDVMGYMKSGDCKSKIKRLSKGSLARSRIDYIASKDAAFDAYLKKIKA